MILTKNDNTGKMETVAGAGILPKIPMIVPDYDQLLYTLESTNSFFVQGGTSIPIGSTYGSVYTVPWDCYAIMYLSTDTANGDLAQNISIMPSETQIKAVRSKAGTLNFLDRGPPVFLAKGTQIRHGIYNNTGATQNLTQNPNMIQFVGTKLTTATPNVIDVGTNPGYSLAEAPVMRTLADGTQEQLQTIDGKGIFQRTFQVSGLNIDTTNKSANLMPSAGIRYLGIVPEYSFFALSWGVTGGLPYKITDTTLDILVATDNVRFWYSGGQSGTLNATITIRYCYT
jgi:hypothetical protein